MKLSRWAAFGLVFALLSPLRAEDGAAADPLAPFGRFVGGAWESEGEFKVRVVYEWGLNKKLIKIKSFLLEKEGPKLVYESTIYHHPGRKQIVFQSVSGNGGLFDGVMTHKGNMYTSEFTSYNGDKQTKYRQTVELTDDDHANWKVYVKDGDVWNEQIDIKEHRVRDGAAR